jgi:hypothetical protein
MREFLSDMEPSGDLPEELCAFVTAVVIPALVERLRCDQEVGSDGRMAAPDSTESIEVLGRGYDEDRPS